MDHLPYDKLLESEVQELMELGLSRDVTSSIMFVGNDVKTRKAIKRGNILKELRD